MYCNVLYKKSWLISISVLFSCASLDATSDTLTLTAQGSERIAALVGKTHLQESHEQLKQWATTLPEPKRSLEQTSLTVVQKQPPKIVLKNTPQIVLLPPVIQEHYNTFHHTTSYFDTNHEWTVLNANTNQQNSDKLLQSVCAAFDQLQAHLGTPELVQQALHGTLSLNGVHANQQQWQTFCEQIHSLLPTIHTVEITDSMLTDLSCLRPFINSLQKLYLIDNKQLVDIEALYDGFAYLRLLDIRLTTTTSQLSEQLAKLKTIYPKLSIVVSISLFVQ